MGKIGKSVLKRPKRYRLPPMTKEGLTKYFLSRGYRLNPSLQDDQGADITFTKPLPRGGQKHLRIWITRTGFKIEEHDDIVDPNRDVVGHFIRDVIINGVTHRVYRIPRRKRKYRKRGGR